nr:uncharacterized protein LOC129268713 [Lytechinus pictus]
MDSNKREISRNVRKKLSKLVGDLNRFEPRTKALFELSVSSVLPLPAPATAGTEHVEPENTGNAIGLFRPASEPPVPKKGRQTYRMWKAMVELESSPFRKSRLTEIIKLLRFIPLESYHISPISINGITSISEFLVSFLKAYFPGLEITLESLNDIAQMGVANRHHKITLKKQYLVTDVYTRLHKATGFDQKDYLLGLTWTDLYPSEDLNFALGEALFSRRCAVFSFGRFEPLLHHQHEQIDGDRPQRAIESEIKMLHSSGESYCRNMPEHAECRSNLQFNEHEESSVLKPKNSSVGIAEVTAEETLKSGRCSSPQDTSPNPHKDKENDVLEITGDLLWKMMRVSSHEMCHLFGISHCVFFHCAMNESKSVKEALSQPLYLCPVCLRKLQKFFGFDVTSRYRGLLEICQGVQSSYPSEQMKETIAWLSRVLEFLSSD